jgi:NAD(P)-dependent dehydrogenase (short-subunit alcohol dehydrogenase family)
MGYGRLTTADEILDGVRLDGKVAVVTGASSGLGREVARRLTECGASVVCAARAPAPSNESSHAVVLDLTSLPSVRRAAEEIRSSYSHIDLLFNNAGVMATPCSHTADGFELQVGTNHLGHFLLTALLSPAIPTSGRIVNTTSLGHMISAMHWEDPHYEQREYEKWSAYGQSKTANVLFTLGLAQRGYVAYAVHPGSISTGLLRHLEGDELAMVEQASEAESKTLDQGVATLLWAAIADGIPSGSYLADCQVSEAAPHASDPEEAQRCWIWSEEQVGVVFPGRAAHV